MKRFSYTIKEEQGIHARPASFLIQEARTYESRITIRVKGKEADASNIIAVMALDVVCGQRVEVEICGTDEGVAYRGMKKFLKKTYKTF
ncbi:MAG: HPr family phosphocarrier protein [Anaerobutyricum sp.]